MAPTAGTGMTASGLARRHGWVIPAALGTAATVYLAWGAWFSSHDPRWLYADDVFWRVWLRPSTDTTLLVTAGLWLIALYGYWSPRRHQRQPVGLITVVTMVAVGAVLATASLVPCRGGMARTGTVAWILELYVGQPPPAYQTSACPGQPSLAFQLAQIVCLGATLIGALAAAAALWRQPVGRLRARFARDATIFAGLDAVTVPLLRRLTETRNPRTIVVIEPDSNHPLLEDARLTGAQVVIGDPSSARLLLPVIAGWRGCALSYLYALSSQVPDNEAVLVAAREALRRYQPDPDRQPHLVVRVDDPRHADYWRGLHSGTLNTWFEDALSLAESTASALVGRIIRSGTRQLVLCGDSDLALAILLELARHVWERRELVRAAAIGRARHSEVSRGLPLESVVLLDPRSADLRREYLATAPRSIVGALPTVIAEPWAWKDQLLATLDHMSQAAASETAVIVADPPSEAGMHEAGRVARLHPGTAVFVLASAGNMDTVVFDSLHPFHPTLLVDGEVPEDVWTRVARHWHECFRLRHPEPPGAEPAPTRRPWADLDDFTRQDNILQLRSIMSAVASTGRQWVPVRAVVPGSFIELSGRELEEVARAEHTRWYRRRLASGWSATGQEAGIKALVNANVTPWTELPASKRAEVVEYLRSQLAQLEDIGFVPVVPAGGPPEAARFERIGYVQAKKLDSRLTWVRPSGEELNGDSGDWRVLDSFGDERTIGEREFHASHERISDELWRRTGTFSAWQVREDLVIQTKEGKASATPGDWVVESPRGERWPVTDEQFRRTYRRTAF